MDQKILSKLQSYLQKKFSNPAIQVKVRDKIADSAEVFIGDEFLAVIYEDREDPTDISYSMEMAILSFDLAE